VRRKHPRRLPAAEERLEIRGPTLTALQVPVVSFGRCPGLMMMALRPEIRSQTLMAVQVPVVSFGRGPELMMMALRLVSMRKRRAR
jgi:hypothetical protein